MEVFMANAASVNGSHTEKVVSEVVSTVKNGKTCDFFTNLWAEHGDEIIHLGKVLLLVVLVALLAWLFTRIVRRIITRVSGRLNTFDASTGHVAFVIVRTFIWLFAFLIVLDLFGINTASIITVLGAVGLAVALAMKDSMSNVAAGVMLMILRPYKTGDYVDCGPVSGTIKTMGIFSTELQTIDGIFIAVPNNVIFGSPVKNYSRNDLRRADITVGIAYDDNLAEGIKVLEKLMLDNELILKEPAPEVLVADLADSSVNLTLRFWVANDKYWDAFWQVKAAIKPAIESAGLNIPFPQRVVTFVNKAE